MKRMRVNDSHPLLNHCHIFLSQLAMKVLIIDSSPRRDGNISRLLARATATATETGASCRVINLYDKDVRYCVACMMCRTKLFCPIKDDMAEIADAIKEADRIVIGAPCYWANMPGVLKAMFDRLAYLFIAEGKRGFPRPLLKGRKALVISTATTPMPFARLFGQTSGTVKSIHRILKMGGIKTVRSLQIGGTMKHAVGEKEFKSVDRRIKALLR